MKKPLSFLFSLLLILSFLPCVAAQEEKTEIRTLEDWNALAADCVLDRYSADLSVSLENDLDFSDEIFHPIPLFAGYFEGNGHTLRGIRETGSASSFGVFRHILEGGEVRNLNVCADLSLEESEAIGGISGLNAGVIRHCSFDGNISAVKSAGGICGVNETSGVILRSKADGTISAQHRSGGICGENAGRIESCRNYASVNTQPLSQVLPEEADETLSAEELLSLTDLGGICGFSSGALVSCRNAAPVGYLHQGSNVGGICGRSSGFVESCRNEGKILGKKDVGGILGQLDPDREWDFSSGNLNELQNRLDTLKADIDSLSEYARKTQEGMSAGVGSLLSSLSGAGAAAANFSADVESWAKENTGISRESLEQFAQQRKDDISSLPEEAQNLPEIIEGLSSELPGMFENLPETIDEIRENVPSETPPSSPSSFESTAPGELIASLQSAQASLSALQGQLSDTVLIEKTQKVSDDLFSVSDYLNGIIRSAGKRSTYRYLKDISLTGEDTVGILSGCENCGDTAGERNIGGIVGAISVDYSLEDADEEEIDYASMISGGAKYLIFAAIESCKSESEIIAYKSTAGGIVGKMDFGAAVRCLFGGEVRSLGAYAGGIAGLSKGSLRKCEARANLSAKKYLGGIAGLGNDLSACLALPYFESETHCLGSIAGSAEGNVSQNYYSGCETGGIDGFSFEGACEKISLEALYEKSADQTLFHNIRIRWLCEDTLIREEMVPYGTVISTLPEMPVREGYRFFWEGLPDTPLTHSLTIEGFYEKPIPTLATREDPPLLLCEGAFEPGMMIEVYDITAPENAPLDTLGAKKANIEGYTGNLVLHLHAPKDCLVYSIKPQGDLEALEAKPEGSYLVFELENGGSFLWAKVQKSPLSWLLPAGCGSLVLIIGLIALILTKKRRKHNHADAASTPDRSDMPEGNGMQEENDEHI